MSFLFYCHHHAIATGLLRQREREGTYYDSWLGATNPKDIEMVMHKLKCALLVSVPHLAKVDSVDSSYCMYGQCGLTRLISGGSTSTPEALPQSGVSS